jgi:divalent metal cation (Fe/Co/Zn/Cd) transporter
MGVQCDIHEIILLKEKDGLNLSFHCSLRGETPINNAHELSERMEAVLREKIPNLENVLIHMEPLDQ